MSNLVDEVGMTGRVPLSTTSSATSAPSSVPQVPLTVSSSSTATTTVKDVLMWKNIKVSATLFVLGNVIFFLTLVSKYTFLRVFSLAGFYYLVIGAVVVNAMKKIAGADSVKKPNLHGSYVSKDSIERHLDDVLFVVNSGIDEIKKAVYCVDNARTLKLIGLFFALSLIGKIFPDLLLAYLLFLGLFIGPITYDKNREVIDKYLEQARQEASKSYDQGMALASEKATQLKNTIAEKSTPLLEKGGPRVQELANKIGLTPSKKAQ